MASLSTRLSQLLEQIGDKYSNDEKNWQSAVDKSSDILHYTTVLTKYLQDFGSRVDTQNHDGKTTLILIAEKMRSDIIEILIRTGICIFMQDKLGNIILKMIGVDNLLRERDIVRMVRRSFSIDSEAVIVMNKLLKQRWSLAKVILFRNVDVTKLILNHGHLGDILRSLLAMVIAALIALLHYTWEQNMLTSKM